MLEQKSAEIVPLDKNQAWMNIRQEAAIAAAQEPMLASFLHSTILHHNSFAEALSFRLAQKLGDGEMHAVLWREIIEEAYEAAPDIVEAALADIEAVKTRDPACRNYLQPLLYFKGYQTLQSYRVAHWLWYNDREPLALFMQSRLSELFAVDIHPAAEIGSGVMIDHATAIVIGETAVVGNNVSILHNVTLGGTGKTEGDRHPKISDGVMIGAGAKVLGNITVGEGAKIAAGSLVLTEVPPRCTFAGVPAKPVGDCCGAPAEAMDQGL